MGNFIHSQKNKIKKLKRGKIEREKERNWWLRRRRASHATWCGRRPSGSQPWLSLILREQDDRGRLQGKKKEKKKMIEAER